MTEVDVMSIAEANELFVKTITHTIKCLETDTLHLVLNALINELADRGLGVKVDTINQVIPERVN